MSSFQDNFHREEEKLLDYDDSAFYYFFISILTVILVPLSLSILKTMLVGEKKIDLQGKNCDCSRCKEIIQKRQKVHAKTWMRPGFYAKVVFTLCLWMVWYMTAEQISKIEPLKSFDPFQILGVEAGAEPSVIKKAYRRLSLLKHPDKNPDDPLAVTEFIQITKAYTTLTDDTARQNWEKYGNPDGPGSFQVAIALPRFLMNKDYQVQVLLGFFVVLLIVIPGWFYFNLDAQNKDVGDISIENRKIFAFLINENMTYKNCPTVLACAVEYQTVKPRSEEASKQLQAIKTDDSTKELIPIKATGKLAELLSMPSLCIILAYMLRMNELNEHLQEDLDFILSKATYLVEMMLVVTNMMRMEFMMRNIKKRIPAKTVLTLISFSQNLVQGMWYDDDAYMQLPYVDYETFKNFKKKNKPTTFENYCRLTTEERRAMGMYEDPKKFEDAEKTIPCFPVIDVKVDYFVEGETDVAVGDILTIKLQITHTNLQEKESLGFVHSNKFPFLKQSSWYLVFTDSEENELMAMDKLVIKEKVHIKEIKERMTRAGTIELTLLLRNDSYRGFDKRIDVKIRVLPDAKRAAVEYDDEDIQASKAPSLMQQMMEVNPEGDSDDEESEDETVASSTKETAAPANATPTAPAKVTPTTASPAAAGSASAETKKEK